MTALGGRDASEGRGQHDEDVGHRWAFLSNHFLVLVCLAEEADLRVREIAARVGITERAAQAILKDLVEAGYVERSRIGRRNRYWVRGSVVLRHPLLGGCTVGALLDTVHEHLAPTGSSSDPAELAQLSRDSASERPGCNFVSGRV